MIRIFHQNMLDYGGRTPVRNATFTAALGAINGITGANYWAAGFTEVLYAGAATQANLPLIAQALDAGLTRMHVIEVGTTLLGRQEFIAIAWDDFSFPVAHVGRVLWDPMNRSWAPHNAAPGAAATQVLPLPTGVAMGADTRGLAYIAGASATTGRRYVIAFMHNMYNLGNKTAAFESLNVMATRARNAIGGNYTDATVVIGGDFNLEPRTRKRPRGSDEFFHARATVAANGSYVNTTNVHPYDFWVVSDAAITDASTQVFVQTRVAHGSDHAGITVTF
ncbi:exonuclease/endonuclease/phosphatase family protein [Pyxidicoccus xibeiensis]|uniref:hypothetical protein n=1 Tax=Pyxidicoccus xibeiensis TaxID=2906759 RepID=UPI0020A745C2|nr:hypothetical protein [Pyxidicoccus xibeiensis]MCP3144432.1 hypothetical protein [Pyxidicoccus xibeiensis]